MSHAFSEGYSFADCAKDPKQGGIPMAELKKLAQQMRIDDTLGKYQICQEMARIYGKEPSEPIAKTLIGKRRALLGEPSEMSSYAGQFLEGPETKRQKARRAVTTRFKTDVATKSGLCNDLKSSMYKDELMELAKELDLPVMKRTTKEEI